MSDNQPLLPHPAKPERALYCLTAWPVAINIVYEHIDRFFSVCAHACFLLTCFVFGFDHVDCNATAASSLTLASSSLPFSLVSRALSHS